MELTKENKDHIDNLSYEELLRHNRYAPLGDPWFEGETGKYWGECSGEPCPGCNGEGWVIGGEDE